MLADVEVCEIRNSDHIWNVVFIDNEYYWIDATWIDDGSTTDVNENIYYCDSNYNFIDHEYLTVPASVYNMEYNVNQEKYEVEYEEEIAIYEEEMVFETTTKPERNKKNITDERITISQDSEEMNINVIAISTSTIFLAVAVIIILSKKLAENKKMEKYN